MLVIFIVTTVIVKTNERTNQLSHEEDGRREDQVSPGEQPRRAGRDDLVATGARRQGGVVVVDERHGHVRGGKFFVFAFVFPLSWCCYVWWMWLWLVVVGGRFFGPALLCTYWMYNMYSTPPGLTNCAGPCL